MAHKLTSDDEALDYIYPILDYLASGPFVPEWGQPDPEDLLHSDDAYGVHRSAERARATLARAMAKLILKAAMSNGLGGCPLCGS